MILTKMTAQSYRLIRPICHRNHSFDAGCYKGRSMTDVWGSCTHLCRRPPYRLFWRPRGTGCYLLHPLPPAVHLGTSSPPEPTLYASAGSHTSPVAPAWLNASPTYTGPSTHACTPVINFRPVYVLLKQRNCIYALSVRKGKDAWRSGDLR